MFVCLFVFFSKINSCFLQELLQTHHAIAETKIPAKIISGVFGEASGGVITTGGGVMATLNVTLVGMNGAPARLMIGTLMAHQS